MENVKDLKNTGPTQGVTTLSNILDEKDTNTVSIDTTTGSGIMDQEESTRPVVKITANMTRKPVRRTITDPSQVNQINPNDYIEKPVTTEAPKPTMREAALSQLDQAVKRKQEEYKAFVEHAIAADAQHREDIENGLETVNDEELQYMPNELHVPMDEKDKVINNTEPIESVESLINTKDEEEFEDFDETENETLVTSNVVVANPFGSVENTFKEDEDTTVTSTYTTTSSEEELVSGTYTEPSVESDNNEYYFYEGQYHHTDITPEDENDIDMLNWNSTVDIKESDYSEPEEVSIDPAPVEEVKEEQEISETKKSDNYEYKLIDKIADSGVSVMAPNFTDEEMLAQTSSEDFDIDEKDLDDINYNVREDEDDLTQEEVDAIFEESEKRLRSEILQKIIQTGKKLDTSQFVVSNKIINANKVLKPAGEKKVEKVASWPLTFAGRVFKATPLKGPEIVTLSDFDESTSRRGSVLTIDQAKIIYEHDANEYKPQTFEGWCKTIPALDIDNLFAALYKATMSGSNYIPRICEKRSCQYSFLEEGLEIDQLVKFDSDEAKKRFESIKEIPLTPENSGQYQSVVNVINEQFAVGLKLPSLYTLLYEFASLSDEFTMKYYSVVNVIQFIDYIYYINPETMQFEPIGWKNYVGDYAKNFKSKVATYAKILKEFDDSDFSVLIALINAMNFRNDDSRTVRLEIPATKCPKCGTEIPALPMTARELVFMRQRLVELVTTPTAR